MCLSLIESVTRSSTVLKLVTELENATRAEIRGRSQRVVDEISKSVQQMWAIVHPGEPIEDVQLYLPDDVDKAIDVRLRFYGVKQDSPRLTLSESYRNSLGLCIFLAMAQREKATDRPIFLDDVIVSLDRNHRGMLVELLEKEFDNRQILIFTHDGSGTPSCVNNWIPPNGSSKPWCRTSVQRSEFVGRQSTQRLVMPARNLRPRRKWPATSLAKLWT